jgi:hypothetical protein
MTDHPKTPAQAAEAEWTRQVHHDEADWDAIAQAAIQASGLVEASHDLCGAMRAVLEGPEGGSRRHHARIFMERVESALAKLKDHDNG